MSTTTKDKKSLVGSSEKSSKNVKSQLTKEETTKHSSKKKEDVNKNRDENDDNEEELSVTFRPYTKRQKLAHDYINLNAKTYSRDNVRFNGSKLKSNNGSSSYHSSSLEVGEQLVGLFYKNNNLLSTPTVTGLTDYLRNLVQKFMDLRPKGCEPTKVSVAEPAPIYLLEAIKVRLDRLFQLVVILTSHSSNNVGGLNKYLCTTMLTDNLTYSNAGNKHVVKSANGDETKTIKKFLSFNNTSSSASSSLLKPNLLFTALALTSPNGLQSTSTGSFSYPESYQNIKKLHEIYEYLMDMKRNINKAPNALGNKKDQQNASSEHKERKKEEHKEQKKEEYRDMKKTIHESLRSMFRNDKIQDDNKLALFCCGDGLEGIYKRYGIERVSEFNKFILELYICLFVKEVAHKIGICMTSNNSTQISLATMKWALSDYNLIL